jgi:hypothetical protein
MHMTRLVENGETLESRDAWMPLTEECPRKATGLVA